MYKHDNTLWSCEMAADSAPTTSAALGSQYLPKIYKTRLADGRGALDHVVGYNFRHAAYFGTDNEQPAAARKLEI
jgi:hypothetical protein